MHEIEDHLIPKYEYILLKAQQYRIPEREATIFDTALNKHHENPITELLAFFLDPNEKHGLETSFYEGFIEAIKVHEKYSEFEFGQILKISTQQATDNGKYIDLWFETDTALIIVEVKVHHIQNNPFPDYVEWGNKKLNEISMENAAAETSKKIITLIFNPNGQSSIDGWSGVSYLEFSSKIKQTLGIQIIHNPLNKWGIFARDFLLHLDSFNDLLETNMESLKFIVENMQKIEELVELRANVYQEIVDYINNELQIALGDEYESNVRWHTWNGNEPAIRFHGKNWKDTWTDSVLNLHINTHPMSCSINIYIENQTDEIIERVNEVLSKNNYSKVESWYEKNKKFWCMSWYINEFELNAVTQQIVFLHQILNCVELEWK